jgi:NAD dependent epimerase/dehydratase family enzyme
MSELAKTLGQVMHRPAKLAVPELALRVGLGEAAEVILASQRVMPERALAVGYNFRYSELAVALRSIVTV